MKKILIYMKEDDLKPTGGPRGYLYNLKCGLEKINENVDFLEGKSIKNKFHKNYEKLPQFVKQYYREIFRKNYYKKLLGEKSKISLIDLNRYSYIHFHSTISMYNVKDSLESYKGRIILTSHTPKPSHLEIYEDSITEKERKKYGNLYKKLEKIDEYAFNKADYIVFPCEYAEEPYYNRWEKYKEIKEKNKQKYRYLLTGTQKCFAKIPKDEVREKYSIPKDAFLISYVGRHNEVKGYDFLKEIGKEILEKNKNVYIICAGKEEPIKRLDNDRWIEVGWTDDPHSIITSSDLFILPNRETYFDLVLLEVLSLGVPLMISNTGGNKYFKKFNSKGITYFTNIDEAITNLNKLIKYDKGKLKEDGIENQRIYNENFTCEIFARNYINLIKTLN